MPTNQFQDVLVENQTVVILTIASSIRSVLDTMYLQIYRHPLRPLQLAQLSLNFPRYQRKILEELLWQVHCLFRDARVIAILMTIAQTV
mmetsp:Transcript_55529/g.113323  ORF Transcript_55529/g.113323 Transcript_55529/m.113323 type:complete len:89 (-) Transcript_55529:3357-3623(-)